MRDKLRAARKVAGLTQQAMADKVGLSLIGYSQIERGVRKGNQRHKRGDEYNAVQFEC